ncbi:reverse ribonuclease integrase, partial [Lasius niger]
MFGKRQPEPVERVPTTPSPENETRKPIPTTVEDTLIHSYVTLEYETLPPLRFFKIKIRGYPLAALVDSGSNRTLLGREGIKIIRKIGFPTDKNRGVRIRTANGQLADIKEEVRIPIELENAYQDVTVALLPNLAVPCILGIDFLVKFGIALDFASGEWYFAQHPHVRYRLATDTTSRETSCCGLSELNSEQERALENFFQTLPEPSPNPGVTELTDHKIDVGSSPPIKQRCYLVSPKVQEAIRAETDKMLAAGIIEPSFSEWSNPIVMVKKPNGKYRFCLDFRKVNSVSKKDAYPLPNMNGILDKLRSARYISTIDLSQAYFQVPLAKESREITAFSVPGMGLFHFTRMPYGLTGAPATFQRLLDRLIGPEMEPHVFAYLDDIVIVTPTFEEHMSWLKKVLDRIVTAGLTVNPDKCEFCRSQVRYLGFIVQQEGLTVDPEKTRPILEYPAPRNLKQLRRFLGMSSWYRRFIPQFATLSEPLTRLLKKGKRWEWGDDQDRAFDQIRDHLVTAPTLACPDFELPFVLQTDASSVGLGAVLTQTIDEEERVIAFASRALADPEKRYSVTEQECLAVVWAIQKFRPYLEGYRFTVVTDHSSLRWLHNLKNPTGRLARWALELLEYDYEIVHRKGALHHVPDALSRMFENDDTEETPIAAINTAHIIAAVDTVDFENTTDEWYRKRSMEVVSNPNKFTQWKVMDGRLYFLRPKKVISEIVEDLDRWKVVIPREYRQEVLRESHDMPQAGHLGTEKTYQRVAVSYFWPNLFRDVTEYVR